MAVVHDQLIALWNRLIQADHRDAEIWLDPHSRHELFTSRAAQDDGSLRLNGGGTEWRGIPLKVKKRMRGMPAYVGDAAFSADTPILQDPPEIVIEYRDEKTGRCVYLDVE